jgi:tRNA A-37 threonylcarbamoyl transferase component Bud32
VSDDFHRFRAGPRVAWIARDFVGELEPLALASPGGLERWHASAPPVAGGRARGWQIALPSGRKVHLREMAHGGWLRTVTGRRFLGIRRATRALRAAAQLRAAGVPVPAPVALVAERHGAFHYLWIASEFVEQACDVGRRLEAARDASQVTAIGRAAARSVRRFHEAGASHPDLHVGNLLARESGEVLIVDLDGVRTGAPPAASRRLQELARLERSLRKLELEPTLAELFRATLRREYAAAETLQPPPRA